MDILNGGINLNGDAIPIMFNDLKQIVGGRSDGTTTSKGIYDSINAISSKNFINNIVSGCIITTASTTIELDPTIKHFDTTFNVDVSDGYVTLGGILYYYKGDKNINPRKSWKFVSDESTDTNGDRISKGNNQIKDIWIKKYAKLVEGEVDNGSWLIKYLYNNKTLRYHFYINTPFISIYKKSSNYNNTSHIINYDNSLIITHKGGRDTPLKITDTSVVLSVDSAEYSEITNISNSLLQISCNTNDVASCLDLKVPISTSNCNSGNNNFINLKTNSGIIGRIYALSNGFGISCPSSTNTINDVTFDCNITTTGNYYQKTKVGTETWTIQLGNNLVNNMYTALWGKVSSDSTLKSNISNLPYNLSTITQLSPVLHNWNEKYVEKYIKSTGIVLLDNATEEEKQSYESQIEKYKKDCDKTEIGLIAQEVLEIIPEVVGKDEDGYYTINYPKLVPVLINGIKEQQSIIDGQQINPARVQNSGRVRSAMFRVSVEKLTGEEASLPT